MFRLAFLFAIAIAVDPLKVVQSYAKYLQTGDCDSWARLFSANGCKIDAPAPACGLCHCVDVDIDF